MLVTLSGSFLEFPVWGLVPKKETGALNLINRYPSYDGTGVVIAIFDSGVDPAAPGLQFCPNNEVKVIDRIDASGAGDVETSTVVEEDEDKFITGLTGRKLKIPSTWENPSGKFHIGVTHAYSLYPQRLKDRIVKEKKEKFWDPTYKARLAEAQKKLQAFEVNKIITQNGTSSNSSSKCSSIENENNSPELLPRISDVPETAFNSFFEKMQKEDAEAKVTLLKALDKKYNDLGPSFDCVVFNDGEMWRACIDTSECGDLEKGVFLGEYRLSHECKPLSYSDQYSISINVHNDGNILEIVGMCSSHGTHVASIAAGYFACFPEKNGIAPGAKIVSITIGDNRLGSMETGTALVRAMARVMENPHYKVDIINMSYGEHAHWSNSGRIGDIVHEVVNKYGIIWIASAGNHGPALSTVGVPPDFFSDSIIGVGAYVSPDMMTAEYSMVEKLPGRPYTWSSRGPTIDGGRGVSVCAPGGAITSVPTFTLKNTQLMNGTSMASPHAAGCVALLLSAMKQKKIPYSPYSVRRAVHNSALQLDIDVFAQGHGLLQVDKALDYLLQNSNGIDCKMRFSIECGKDRTKGIYLRNWLADKAVDIPVNVEPFIFDDLRADPEDKLAFCAEFVLTCEATWVKSPPCLHTSYTPRSFKITIDPRGLERGQVYVNSVKAYLANQPEKGMIFEIPVTLVVPHIKLSLNYQFHCPLEPFRSGRVRRHFLSVPLAATYASVTIKASLAEKVQRFTLHTVQLKPSCSVTTLEFYKVINLGSNESTTVTFAVRGGYTLEICLARWWSCLVDGQMEIIVDFHSVQVSQEEVCFASSDGVQRIDVRAGLRTEELLPQASLKQHSQVLVPVESKVEVLGGARDTIAGGRPIYQLILTYNLSVIKSGVEVTPKCSLLNDVLYESAYESQLWMLFDCNKHLLMSGDAFSSKYAVKLDKGEYVIRLHVRHERSDLLDKLVDLPLTILNKLPQEIKLDLYTSFNAAVTAGRKAQPMVLCQGCVQPFYICPPNLSDKNFKALGLAPGHALLGVLSFGKEEQVRKADQYPLRIFVTELSCKKRNVALINDEKKDLKDFADYQEAIKDIKTSWISKLDMESSERLYQEITTSHPDHLPALLARLQTLDNNGAGSREAVISLSQQIIDAIDIAPLLAFYGTKTDTRSDATKIRTQMDRQKNILLETLARKGNALYANLKVLPKEDWTNEALQPLDSIASDIVKFVDASDSKVINFFINYYQMRGLDGLALRLTTKLSEEKWTKENEARLIEIYERFNWTHISKLLQTGHNGNHAYAGYIIYDQIKGFINLYPLTGNYHGTNS